MGNVPNPNSLPGRISSHWWQQVLGCRFDDPTQNVLLDTLKKAGVKTTLRIINGSNSNVHQTKRP